MEEREQRESMIPKVDKRKLVKQIKESIGEQVRLESSISESSNQEEKKKYEDKLQEEKDMCRVVVDNYYETIRSENPKSSQLEVKQLMRKKFVDVKSSKLRKALDNFI
jgi:carbamoylphosphate synthase small subunit